MLALKDGFSTSLPLSWVNQIVVITALSCCSVTTVWAGTRALPNGQANIPQQVNTINLDISGVAGADEQRTGVRFAFPRFSDHFTPFIEVQSTETIRDDVAVISEVDSSGTTRGGGIYISDLPEWNNFNVNLRFSILNEELDVDSNIAVQGVQAIATVETRSVAIAALLSPVKPLFNNGANGYLSFGASYQRSERRVLLNGRNEPALSLDQSDVQPQIALGLIYPYKRISLFASMEYEESLALGLGLRVQLSRAGF